MGKGYDTAVRCVAVGAAEHRFPTIEYRYGLLREDLVRPACVPAASGASLVRRAFSQDLCRPASAASTAVRHSLQRACAAVVAHYLRPVGARQAHADAPSDTAPPCEG